jgi:hypothetical protein
LSSGEIGGTVVFLGAGASHCVGIPMADDLIRAILQIRRLRPELLILKERFLKNNVPFNTETLLAYLETSSNREKSFLDAGAALLGLTNRDRCFNLDSVTRHADLAKDIKAEIKKRCYVGATHNVKFPEAVLQERFGYFLNGLTKNRKLDLKRKFPRNKPKYPNLEFFTTNYDNVLDKFFSLQKIDIIDGYTETGYTKTIGAAQIGNEQDERPTFKFDEIEFNDSDFPRIHKLFGCVMYARQGKDIFRIEPNVWPYATNILDLLIYPGSTKIIWTEPQLQLFHRFHQRLNMASNCVVIGYSFHDPAVNGIFTHAALNSALHIYCVCGKYTKKIVQRVFGDAENVTPVPKTFERLNPVRDIG